ncbi:hypothetical protein [Bdellovibrio sp.]|uniref:hypothetical protein n=1 Tax=Bdellovibrio sp. TaxID=28201 RepID=UPI0032219C38
MDSMINLFLNCLKLVGLALAIGVSGFISLAILSGMFHGLAEFNREEKMKRERRRT